MAVASPTVARRELALRLTSRRKDLPGVNVATISKRLGFTRNYWSSIENNRAVLTEENLDAVLDLLEFGPQDRAELVALHSVARQRGWWDLHRNLYPDEVLRFFGLEYGAKRIRTFESLLVPGLLQTEEYARAVLGADPQYSPVELDELVKVRMIRQKRLQGDDPLDFSVIVSEAALRQHTGGGEVQLRQLQYLVDVIEGMWDTIAFRVVPFTTDLGMLANASTLVFLDFDSHHLGTLAWQESIRPLGVTDDSERIRRLGLSWDDGRRKALDRQQSLGFVRRVASDLG